MQNAAEFKIVVFRDLTENDEIMRVEVRIFLKKNVKFQSTVRLQSYCCFINIVALYLF